MVTQYSIYKITNKVNGKIYIGRTKRCTSLRFKEHKNSAKREKGMPGCRVLNNAIRKYGENNFTIEILEICSDYETMKKREGELIRDFNSTCRDIGYNLEHLTENGKEFISEETRFLHSKNSHELRFSKRSGKTGIVFYPQENRKKNPWMASISCNKERFCKFFPSKNEALEWYDKLALYFYGEKCSINLEHNRSNYLECDLSEMVGSLREEKRARELKVRGIHFCKKAKTYQCIYKNLIIGYYKTEREATEIRDRVALFYNETDEIVFKENIEKYEQMKLETSELLKFCLDDRRVNRKNKSGLYGVSQCSRSSNWTITTQLNKIKVSKKGFKTKEIAGLARDILVINRVKEIHEQKLNFPISSIFMAQYLSEKEIPQILDFLIKLK